MDKCFSSQLMAPHTGHFRLGGTLLCPHSRDRMRVQIFRGKRGKTRVQSAIIRTTMECERASINRFINLRT